MLRSTRALGDSRVCVWAAAAWLMGLAACAAPQSQPVEVAALDRIRQQGQLRACYQVEPPSIIRDASTGELSGNFISALRAMAAGLKVEPVFVQTPLSNFASALNAHECDVSLGPTFKTIDRAALGVAFTDAVYYLGYTAVVREGTEARLSSEAVLEGGGVRIATRTGSPIDRHVRDRYAKAEFIATTGDDLTLPLAAVLEGRADIGFMNEHTVEAYVAEHPGLRIVFADQPKQMGGMSWSVRAGDQQLLNFLNNALEYLIVSGQMEAWERASFGRPLRHRPDAPAR